MALELTFLISGVCLALLIFEKVRMMRKGKNSLFLRLISKGDESLAELSHRTAHFYADSKEEATFFLKKQLPLHAKNTYNKSSAVVKEKLNLLVGDIRGSKFLKKNEGISEFFKALSEKEDEALEIEASERDLEDSQKKDNQIK